MYLDVFCVLLSILPSLSTCLSWSLSTFTGHNYIGTEHLLLGLLREGEGVAARVLENLGADPSNIRTQVCCALCLLVVLQTFF